MPTRASMPWFQFDARDYLSDERVDATPQEAIGLLIRVWCVCWVDGSAPADQDELCRKTRCRPEYVSAHLVDILPFFEVRDRRLFSRRMDRQKRLSAIRAESGKKGFARAKQGFASANFPQNLPEQNTGLPEQSSGLPEQKGDLPSILPIPLPSKPLSSKTPNDGSEKAPEGLSGFQYAAGLLEKLGMVTSKSNLAIVAESIRLLAKDEHITEPASTDLMESRALAARARGELINRFWFEDSKWRPLPLRPTPPPLAPNLITDSQEFLREMCEAEARVRAEKGHTR